MTVRLDLPDPDKQRPYVQGIENENDRGLDILSSSRTNLCHCGRISIMVRKEIP